MDNINLPAWIGKAVYAVGIAAVLGSGTTLLDTAQRTAVLEAQREADHELLIKMDQKLDRLIEREIAQ